MVLMEQFGYERSRESGREREKMREIQGEREGEMGSHVYGIPDLSSSRKTLGWLLYIYVLH